MSQKPAKKVTTRTTTHAAMPTEKTTTTAAAATRPAGGFQADQNLVRFGDSASVPRSGSAGSPPQKTAQSLFVWGPPVLRGRPGRGNPPGSGGQLPPRRSRTAGHPGDVSPDLRLV